MSGHVLSAVHMFGLIYFSTPCYAYPEENVFSHQSPSRLSMPVSDKKSDTNYAIPCLQILYSEKHVTFIYE